MEYEFQQSRGAQFSSEISRKVTTRGTGYTSYGRAE
jgi:hypothetical protein